jgi:hypothetical protein
MPNRAKPESLSCQSQAISTNIGAILPIFDGSLTGNLAH